MPNFQGLKIIEIIRSTSSQIYFAEFLSYFIQIFIILSKLFNALTVYQTKRQKKNKPD